MNIICICVEVYRHVDVCIYICICFYFFIYLLIGIYDYIGVDGKVSLWPSSEAQAFGGALGCFLLFQTAQVSNL